MNLKPALAQELRKEMRAERYDITPTGLYFPRPGVAVNGEYFGRVNGGGWEKEGDNLVPTEGMAHILNVALGSTAKPAGYYLAICAGSATPDGTWTASNYATVASEITSMTEGHTGATRPQWVPTNAITSSIDNLGNSATLTIATAGTLSVTGAALLSNSQRGGTGGVLVSASLFSMARTFQNGDTYDIKYRLNLV